MQLHPCFGSKIAVGTRCKRASVGLKDNAQYTWDNGIYLVNRRESHFVINLFHVDKFYVEVWFNPEEVCINKIGSFKSERCLEPYLDEIDIEL